jgi:hypothetical protein
MIEQGILKINAIAFITIIIFIFSGCVDHRDRFFLPNFTPFNAKPHVVPFDIPLQPCIFNCEPDLCEIVGDEKNILSTQTIDLATIKENQADRKTGDQLILACLAKPKKSRILADHIDWANKTHLNTSNIYGHANGYQTDDSRIIKNLARKNCQKLLKRFIAKGEYIVPSGLLVCRATCDMCRY